MMQGDTSLWESFPRVLKRRAGTRRYVGAFRAPFQDLRLSPPQEHALRACSILAIPPLPPGQEVLPGGVSEDLSQDNLSTWAETVQDVSAGMIAPRPETSLTIFPQVVEVLTILESVSRVTFCHQCYLPGSACRCLGGSFTASTTSTAGQSWSDIADPTFGPNSASAGGGTPSAPPYGSPATAGGSIWDLPYVDYPRFPGAPTAIRQPRPPAGRASHLESQLMAIRYAKTAQPDPLRLPRPTDRFSRHSLHIGLILPRRLTRASRRRPRTWSMKDKEAGDRAEPGHVAGPIKINPPQRCLISHAPPSRPRDVLVEGLNPNSSGLLTGTRWPRFQPTIVGAGRRTWIAIWGLTFISTTDMSPPPNGQSLRPNSLSS